MGQAPVSMGPGFLLPFLALVEIVASRGGRRRGAKRPERGGPGAFGPGPPSQPVEKPLGVRGPQPPEAIIGFGGVYGKSAKSLA